MTEFIFSKEQLGEFDVTVESKDGDGKSIGKVRVFYDFMVGAYKVITYSANGTLLAESQTDDLKHSAVICSMEMLYLENIDREAKNA